MINDDYINKKALSYSALSLFRYNPRLYYIKYILNENYEDKKSLSFRIGSAVDDYITDQSQFLNKYVTIDLKLGTNNKDTFIRYLCQGLSYEEAYRSSEIKRPSLDKLILEIENDPNIASIITYHKEGKVIIGKDELKAIEKMGEDYKRMINTITDKLGFTFETEYQKPVFFEYDNIECKIKPDTLIVDHYSKKAICIDIKTTSQPINQSSEEISKWNYWIEAELYTRGVQSKYPDYEVEFYFMWLNTKFPYNGKLQRYYLGDYSFNGFWNHFKKCKELNRWEYKDALL